MRAEIEFELGRFQDAALSYFSITISDPDNSNAHYNLALCLERCGRWDVATEAFQRVLQLDGDREDARLGLGACLLHLNRAEEALAIFTQCGRGSDVGPALIGQSSRLLQLLDRFDEAGMAYSALLASDPNSEEALSNLIAMGIQADDLKRVREHSLRLFEICPHSEVALQGLATVAFEGSDYSAAAAYCDQLLDLVPDCLEAWHNFSDCHGPFVVQLYRPGFRFSHWRKTMNRLRVRVELNRRKSGVPLNELVSVVDETRKFFQLLAEDVEIPVDRGEWQASNFDPESLNFTAEYSGPASAEQIRAFGSAFGGATSLRRETIAQFTHIADFIGEDELVGFGLYQSDQESEPSDWRCLSRRDALRFADEIQLLAKAAGASESEAPLPAVMNGSVGGRRLFKDRRERETLATDPSKWIRDVESTLTRRISLLEGEVEAHAHKLHGAWHNSGSRR